MKGYIIFLLALCLIVPASVLSQCGTTDIAINKPVTGSTEVQWGFFTYAVDNNNTSFWRSQTDGTEWITVDLQQSYNICKVVITWEGSTYFPTSYKVQTSSDNSTWTDIYSTTTGTGGVATLNITGTGRYVKILATVPSQTWQDRYEIYDLKIFNSTGGGNTNPTTSITSPSNNASFTTGSNIVIDATASDPDGTVSKVEFFQGATKLGEDLTSPYSYTWTNVQAGSYALTTVATDNANGTATSSVVNVTVSAPSGGAGWSLTGNAGITASQFFGTTDNQPLSIKTDNTERLRILGTGNMGVGTATPGARFEINSSTTSSFASGFNNNLRLSGLAPGFQLWDTDHSNGWQLGIDGGQLSFGLLFSQTSAVQFPLTLQNNGIVKIGSLGRTESDAKLTVDGAIYAKKIKVTQTTWADFVFEKGYKLPKLAAIEAFIRQNRHLPGIPSAAVVEKEGIDVAGTQALLLQKIEELTLYIIELNKKLENQEKQIKQLKGQRKN